MRYNSKAELMKRLEDEVAKTVESYQTDFTDHDLATFSKNPEGKFLWMTRTCGTWLFQLDCEWSLSSTKFLKAVVNQRYKVHNWFLISFKENSIVKVDDIAVEYFAGNINQIAARREECPDCELSAGEIEYEFRREMDYARVVKKRKKIA